MFDSVPDQYKSQEMCNKAAEFLLSYIPMKVYSISMKTLVMLYFLVMKWVFLV